MPKANIVVREKDRDTETYALLDIISIEIPTNPKAARDIIGTTLLRFFLDVHNKYSDISDINIEFER